MGCCFRNQAKAKNQQKYIQIPPSASVLVENQQKEEKKIVQPKSLNKQHESLLRKKKQQATISRKKNQIDKNKNLVEKNISVQNPEIATQQSLNKYQFANKLFQVIIDKPQFQNLLNKEFYTQYCQFFKNQYFTPTQVDKFIQLLLDYMQFSLSCLSSDIKNQTSYTLENFTDQFGKNAQQIINTTKIRNIIILNNLNYFLNFKKKNFKLNEYRQIYETAHQVKILCANDSTALVYLSGYFVKCCKILQQQKVAISQINSILKQKAKKIKQVFSVTEKTQQELKFVGQQLKPRDDSDVDSICQLKGTQLQNLKEDLELIKTFQIKYKIKQFKFKTNNKQQEIDSFVMEMVDMAKKHIKIFKQITYQICDKNQGYGYKCNLKISQKTQQMPLLRVKQKLLGKYVKEIYKNKKQYPDIKTIQELKEAQIKYFKSVLKKVYQQLENVPFIVTDILRGKCMFNQIRDIVKSVQDIKNNVQQRKNKGQPFQIVAIKNRLKGITKDVMILIKIQDIVCEFQLVLKFNQAQNDIHHKMYQIERSIAFTPIYVLHEWHMRSCKNFLQLSNKVIMTKEEEENFKQQKDNLNKLKQMFQYNKELNLQMYQQFALKKQVILFNQIMKKVENVPQTKNKQIQIQSYSRASKIFKCWGKQQLAIKFHNQHEKINGESLISIKNVAQLYQAFGKYAESINAYEKYITILNTSSQIINQYSVDTTILQISKGLMKLCKNDEAFNLIQQQIKSQQSSKSKLIINSYVLMGDFYYYGGKNKDALQSYKKAKKQSINLNMKQTQIYVEAISKMGYITALLGYYKSASDLLTKAFNIASNKFGAYSIPVANIYSLIGKVYSQMGRYYQAIQNLTKSALMISTILNKLSVQYVETSLDRLKVLIQAKQYQGIGNAFFEVKQIIQELCEEGSMLEIRCDILHTIYLRQVQGDYQKQIEILLQASQKIKKFSLPDQNPIKLKILQEMGNALAYKDQFLKAEFFYYGAQTVLTKIYGEDCLKATQLRWRIANFEGWRKNYDEGIKILNRNIKYFQQQKLTNNIHYSNNLIQLAYQQTKIGQYQQSNKNYRKAQQIIKILGGTESGHMAQLHWNWGISLGQQKNYQQAMNKFQISFHIQQKKNFKIQSAKCAYLLLKDKKYDKFYQLYIEQKENQREIKNNEYEIKREEYLKQYGDSQDHNDKEDDEENEDEDKGEDEDYYQTYYCDDDDNEDYDYDDDDDDDINDEHNDDDGQNDQQ